MSYKTTPDQLRCILVEIRRTLYGHPKVLPDPARVRFVGFGEYSLDLDVFAYIDTTDYGEYLEIAEDLSLRVMDIVAQAGIVVGQVADMLVHTTGDGEIVRRDQSYLHGRKGKMRFAKLLAVALQPKVRGVTLRPRQVWRSIWPGPISSGPG